MTTIKGKPVKRKKQPEQFAADSIDNTAPVKKILDDLQHKNSQAFGFYSQTIRQRRTKKDCHHNYHFAVTGHPLNAFTEEWDGDLNSGYFESFPYKSLMPKIVTNMCNINKNDPVSEYMKLKTDWKRELRNLKISVWYGNMVKNYESLNEEVVQCPKHFVDMAAHLDSDPDPYFDSSYNWYYAGNGNLQLICVDWVNYLLHSEFSTLYLTQFSKSDMSFNTSHAATFDCGEGNNIFETIYSSNNIIALRTKLKIFILKLLNSNDTLQVEQIKVIESEMPFTSITFDDYHKNIMYVSTLTCKLTIVNLDRMTGRTVRLKCRITSLVDNWNTVVSSDRIYYTHATRNSITIYDKRTNEPSQTWSGLRDITDEIGCNDITVVKQPDKRSTLYIGTDHHLFLMDIRFFSELKMNPVQRWTHGMQCVPTYMSMCNFEFNKEIVCLGSQWCEDTCVVVSYTDRTKDTDIHGVTMPYRPPSILNALHEARQKMLCFDLYNPIDKRLATALTGNLILDEGENYIILTHNSLGDISAHVLFPEHMATFINDDSVQNLHDWSQSFKLEKKIYEVSHIENISNTWRFLKKVPDGYQFVENDLSTQKFKETDIFNAFDNEELDSGLLDIWTNTEETREESSLALNLHYSDECE